MELIGIVRKGEKQRFFIYAGDYKISHQAARLSPEERQRSFEELVDDLIMNHEQEMSSVGDLGHIILREDGTGLFPHDYFLAELAKNGETWQEPVAAGPEADAFLAEIGEGEPSPAQTKIIVNAAVSKSCMICPLPDSHCLDRKASFNRSAFDAAVAELGNVQDAPSEEDENPLKDLVSKLKELTELLFEGDDDEAGDEADDEV